MRCITNFLTASVEIVVDDSKLNAQLAKVKQNVMKSTASMEKSYRKQDKAIEVVNKSLTATVRFTRTLFGQTIRVEKVLGRWSTAAWNFHRRMVRNLLILSKIGSITKNIAVTLGKGLVWSVQKAYAGIKKMAGATKELNQEINKGMRVPSILGMILHPKRTWRELKENLKEQAGTVDMVNDSLDEQTKKMPDLIRYMKEQNEQTKDAIYYEGQLENIRQQVIAKRRIPKRGEEGLVLYDISGIMVESYKKIYAAAKWAFGGIADFVSSTFRKIVDMSIWTKTGIIAAFVGAYYAVTKAAMDVEDALSMEELGPTRTVLRELGDAIKSIAAVLGKPFLTNIRLISSAMTDWLEKSTPQIKVWAEAFAKKLAAVQMALADWVKFLTTDFKGGVDVALKVILQLFYGLANTVVITMTYAGDKAAAAFTAALAFGFLNYLPGVFSWLDEKLKGFGRFLLKSTEKEGERISRLTGIPLKRKMQYRTFDPRTAGTALGPKELTAEEKLSADIVRMAEERAGKIKKILEAMPTWGDTEVVAAENAEKQIKKSALVLEAVGDAMAQHRAKMLEEGGKLVEMQLRLDVEKINQIMEENFFARFQRGIAQMKVDMITWGDIGQTVAESMKSSFANAYYSMTTEGKKWADAMKGFALDVLRAIQRSLAAQTASMIMTGVVGPIISGIGGALGGGMAAAGASVNIAGSSAANPMAVYGAPTGLQHGGEVLQTGWAKVHKGERYSGENNEQGFGTVVNISDYAGVDIEVDEYKDSDQRILDVSLRAAAGNGTYRRAHKIR